jgi:protein SCO1/2
MRHCCAERAASRSNAPRRLAQRAACILAGVFATCAPVAALDYDAALRTSQAAVGRSLGEHVFTSSTGARVRIADFRGRPLLVSFVYTGCGQVCPTTTRFLDKAVREARRELGPDAFAVATIGFNVPFDNPAAMALFARQQGIDESQWRFLSPDAAGVERLTGDFGFVYEATAGGFDHVAQLTLVDGDGRIARQIYGDTFDPALLVAALRDTASGTSTPAQDLGRLLERVRLLCTVYDTRTGRYRLDYALFVEIFAGLTVLGAIAHYLLREWRRQRKSAPRRIAA